MGFLYLLPIAALTALIVGVTYFVGKLQRWKALPTQAQSPSTCSQCQSTQTIEKGLWGANSLERVFYCAQCHHRRFRNDLPDQDA